MRLLVASATGVIELAEAPEVPPSAPLPSAERLRLESLRSDLFRRLVQTTLGPATKELFIDELDVCTVQTLHRILMSDGSGAYNVETNMLDIRIDFDARLVTICHLLGEAPRETMPVEGFHYLIVGELRR